MKVLSIEFTSDYIYLYKMDIAKKEVVLEGKYRTNMPPNAYFNRMLINNDRGISDAIRNCISEHGIKYKKTVVTIPNTDSMVEEFSVLGGSKKQMDGMVEQELRKRHKLNADYLYDYIILGDDPLKPGFIRIQVTLCVKAMIQNIYEVIKKAGLIPHKIVFTNHAMKKVAEVSGLMRALKSSIIACINPDEAHFLYVGHGEEPYYRYSRLKVENKVEENLYVLSNINNVVEENNDEDVIFRKIQGDLSRLERFHTQRHPDERLEHIYLYGSYDKIPGLAEELTDFLNIQVLPFSLQDEIVELRYMFVEDEYTCNAVVAAMSLRAGSGEYDFFGKYEETRNGGRDNSTYLPVMVGGVLLVLVLGATLITRMQGNAVRNDTAKLTAYLMDEEVQRAYAEKNQMIEECGRYTRYNSQVAAAIELLENMPRFESGIFREIDRIKPLDVVITGYSYSNGTVNLGCYAQGQYTPAEFAKALKESGNYADVIYNGFNKSQGILGEEYYTFNIAITLW